MTVATWNENPALVAVLLLQGADPAFKDKNDVFPDGERPDGDTGQLLKKYRESDTDKKEILEYMCTKCFHEDLQWMYEYKVITPSLWTYFGSDDQLQTTKYLRVVPTDARICHKAPKSLIFAQL